MYLLLILINLGFISSYLFTSLMNTHILNIQKIGGYKELETTNNFVTNTYYSSDIFRKIRLTKLQTNTKQLFSSIFIPNLNYSAPILTVDTIKYSPELSVILINIYTSNDIHIKNLLEIKYEYLEYYYKPKTNLNNYKKIMNRSSLYSLYNDNKINKYCEIFDVYFTAYLKMFEYDPNKSSENNNFQMNFNINKKEIDVEQYKECIIDIYLENLTNQHHSANDFI